MIASIFTRYKRGGVAEFQEFLFLKLLFIRYLLVKADSLVKPDHDPRTRCLYATHSTVCDGTILWPFPRFSQAAVANTHLPVYRTYAERVRRTESYNLFLRMPMGRSYSFSIYLPHLDLGQLWTVLLG